MSRTERVVWLRRSRSGNRVRVCDRQDGLPCVRRSARSRGPRRLCSVSGGAGVKPTGIGARDRSRNASLSFDSRCQPTPLMIALARRLGRSKKRDCIVRVVTSTKQPPTGPLILRLMSTRTTVGGRVAQVGLCVRVCRHAKMGERDDTRSQFGKPIHPTPPQQLQLATDAREDVEKGKHRGKPTSRPRSSGPDP